MIEFPEPALVVLVGPSGAGKSEWAHSRFRSNEIVSFAELRGIAGSDNFDRHATRSAYELLERIVDIRLDRGLTVVVDTDGLDDGRRSRWLGAARSHTIPAWAVLFTSDVETCLTRDADSPQPKPINTVKRQAARCAEIGPTLEAQGFTLCEVSVPYRPDDPSD